MFLNFYPRYMSVAIRFYKETTFFPPELCPDNLTFNKILLLKKQFNLGCLAYFLKKELFEV